MALSPSGRLAVVACGDGTLRSLDPGTGESGWTLATGPSTARAVAVAPDLGPVVQAVLIVYNPWARLPEVLAR